MIWLFNVVKYVTALADAVGETLLNMMKCLILPCWSRKKACGFVTGSIAE